MLMLMHLKLKENNRFPGTVTGTIKKLHIRITGYVTFFIQSLC